MSISSTAVKAPTKYNILLLLALIIAGLAGNYFKYPIFLNIDFLFGGIFALLALQFFGFGRGIMAAAVIAGYTFLLWNHPYAIIIQTAEVAFVGWLMCRRRVGMVLSDTLFWLIFGMPLVYLFYHVVMHVPLSSVYITMTKQAVNGIANALIARLIFNGYALRSRSSKMSFREIVYNLLTVFVLTPTLILLAVSSRSDFNETDQHIRLTLNDGSARLNHYISTWVGSRKATIVNLADLAASRTPQQLQPHLEFINKSDVNFPRVGLLDKTATITAYAPLVDEFGVSNIGISAADRPYVQTLRKTLKPMLSEVLMGRVGPPKPRVFMLAPVVIRGEYNGYVVGVMSLEQVREQLDKSLVNDGTLYTLLDKNSKIILTNRPDQKVMTPFERGKGTLNIIDKNISQWVPTLPPNTPASERWKKSYYTMQSTVGDLAEWQLILEQPVAPFQKVLFNSYSRKLFLLFLILLGALALAEFLSRRIVATLEKLRLLTHELPLKLTSRFTEVYWPESGITETTHLISNFREMADSLAEQMDNVRHDNELLEQRVAERTSELFESERFIANVMDSLEANIAVLDTDGIITAVNDRWKEFALNNGVSNTTAFVGYNYLAECKASCDRGDKDARAAFIGIDSVLQGKSDSFTMEYPCHSPTEIRWFMMNVTRLTGIRKGAVIANTNITNRRQVEELLRCSTQRFKSIIEASPVPNALNDTGMNITYLNPAFIKSFGYTLEDIPTLDVWWELAYPDPEYRQMIICEWSSHFDNANNGIFEPLEAKIRCKDGTTRTVLASAAPLQESFAGEHLVILFDITERMLAENALLESHRFLDSIIDQSSINMWVSDSKGTLLRANEALRRQLNVTDDELVGIYNIFEDPIVVGQGFLPQVLEVFDKGQATRFTINYDTSHNHNLNPEKRSQAILEVTISPVLNSDGVVTNAIIQHFDISELKQLEHELKEAKTVAESANRAKSEFLANMSHEIRTPLHGLLGMAQLLEMTPLTEEQKEYLAALKLSGKNLVSLINDILDLSKIEAGKITIEMNEFSLRCAIDEVYLMQKSAIFFKNLSFRVTIDEQIPHLIQGDQLRVKQIIHNLLGNAAKFTKQGGITIAARIHELHYGSCVIEISVTDTGIGIAAEALEKIFNPFVQEDGSTTRQFGGTGLGLTISRHLTELMGGSISVVSSQGVGSTFKIKLPFIIPAALHTTEIKAPLAVPLWDAPPLRILLVEDNPVNQIYCRALLGMHGHEIMTAENGEECLEAVDRVQFDLILMDIQMPLMNGREALRAIRSKEERTSRHQRVIALTAHALHGAKENFLAEGFDGYLSKPMEQGALITEMKRVMNLTFGSN